VLDYGAFLTFNVKCLGYGSGTICAPIITMMVYGLSCTLDYGLGTWVLWAASTGVLSCYAVTFGKVTVYYLWYLSSGWLCLSWIILL